MNKSSGELRSESTEKDRVFLLCFGVAAVLSALVIIVINYSVDPWRYFHESRWAIWEGDGRQQNPGIVRNKQFETLIIGTSMTQNFQPDELQAMYGGTAAVLSISAGTGKEQSLTTQMTLRYQPNLKNVLWGVHPGSYSAGKDVIKGNSFPSYLYDEYWLNDIFYLFNVSTFKKSLKDVRGDSNGHYADWRGLQNWHGRYKYGCPSALRLQLDRRGLPQPADDWLGSLDNIRANVSQNLYAVVKENPEVNFTFFFPPFSNLYWNLLAERQPQRFEAYRTTMLEVVTQLLDQPNVEIYDFSSISSITDNLNNYRDLTHFSGTISSRLLAYISNGEYRISDKHKFLKRFETMPLNKSNIKSVISDCLSS